MHGNKISGIPDKMPAVVLERVSRSFWIAGTKRVALDDVSLTLHQGEVVGLIGPSGSGKSTLLRHIAGLTLADNPESRISVLGREVQSARAPGFTGQCRASRNRFHFPAIQPDRPVARADQCPDRPTGPDITPAPLDRLVHNRRDARRHGRAGPGGNQRSGGTACRHPLRRVSNNGLPSPGLSCSARASFSPTNRSPHWTRNPRVA